MRQPINLNQAEIDKLAEKTDELSNWLEEKALQVTSHVVIPPEIAAVSSIVFMAGLALFLDQAIPDALCWYGGCNGVA